MGDRVVGEEAPIGECEGFLHSQCSRGVDMVVVVEVGVREEPYDDICGVYGAPFEQDLVVDTVEGRVGVEEAPTSGCECAEC